MTNQELTTTPNQAITSQAKYLYTIYEIHQQRLLLDPKTAKPYKSYGGLNSLFKKRFSEYKQINKNIYQITKPMIEDWNNAVKFIHNIKNS